MKTILFDMDGTLWNTSDITYKIANEVGSKYPDVKHISKEAIDKSMGLNKSGVAENYMPYLDKERRELISDKIMENVSRYLNEYGGNVYPGVIDTLRILKDSFKLGVVTNNINEYAESFARTTKTEDCFDYLYGAASYGISKGELIRKIIKDNNLEDVIYIGDTVMDLEASKVANIPFIYASYGFGNNVTEYSNIIKEFKELLDVLDK